jgi:hypothetical protein
MLKALFDALYSYHDGKTFTVFSSEKERSDDSTLDQGKRGHLTIWAITLFKWCHVLLDLFWFDNP